jgi:hypothetical protein
MHNCDVLELNPVRLSHQGGARGSIPHCLDTILKRHTDLYPYGAPPQHCDGSLPFMMIDPLHNDGSQPVAPTQTEPIRHYEGVGHYDACVLPSGALCWAT